MERETIVFHESASELQTTSEGNTDGPQAATEMNLAVRIFRGSIDFVYAGKKELHNVSLTLLINVTKYKTIRIK